MESYSKSILDRLSRHKRLLGGIAAVAVLLSLHQKVAYDSKGIEPTIMHCIEDNEHSCPTARGVVQIRQVSTASLIEQGHGMTIRTEPLNPSVYDSPIYRHKANTSDEYNGPFVEVGTGIVARFPNNGCYFGGENPETGNFNWIDMTDSGRNTTNNGWEDQTCNGLMNRPEGPTVLTPGDLRNLSRFDLASATLSSSDGP